MCNSSEFRVSRNRGEKKKGKKEKGKNKRHLPEDNALEPKRLLDVFLWRILPALSIMNLSNALSMRA